MELGIIPNDELRITIPIAIGNEWAFLCLGGFHGVRYEKGKWHRAKGAGHRLITNAE